MIQIVDLHAGKLGARIAAAAGATLMPIEHRHFPDGESYLRVLGDPRGGQLWIVADLVPADATLLPVLLLAASLREQGAARARPPRRPPARKWPSMSCPAWSTCIRMPSSGRWAA